MNRSCLGLVATIADYRAQTQLPPNIPRLSRGGRLDKNRMIKPFPIPIWSLPTDDEFVYCRLYTVARAKFKVGLGVRQRQLLRNPRNAMAQLPSDGSILDEPMLRLSTFQYLWQDRPNRSCNPVKQRYYHYRTHRNIRDPSWIAAWGCRLSTITAQHAAESGMRWGPALPFSSKPLQLAS